MPHETALEAVWKRVVPQSAMGACELKHGTQARAYLSNVQILPESS